MSDPPRGDNPPVPPPVDTPAPAPAAAPSDRAAVDAARMETERLRLIEAIENFNVHYNVNGGPPLLRLMPTSPNGRVGHAPDVPPRVSGSGPAQILAPRGGQAQQPGLQQPLRNEDRIDDGEAGRLHTSSNPESNTKESKYEVFNPINAELVSRAVYTPTQNETTFQKQRWSYTGQEPFEDFAHRMGSSARSLAVGDVCFKNVLYQSIHPPCTIFILDMEPSADGYIFMDKRTYAEAINDRLEPRGARDLIFQQFLERVQKPAEIFDLYLRDKFQLFLRSYPPGQSRIFKDFVESTIRGLHNEILRNKVRDYLATMLISGKPVTDFESFRSLVQVAVESITNRALAGELDSAETAGTNIQLMNYSYIHSEKVGQTDTSSKNRYKVNHLDEDNVTIEEINAFNKFRKYNSNIRRPPREAQEDDVCYNCEKKGHFSRNCPRNMLITKSRGVNQIGATNVPGLVNSSESEDSSSDEDPKINYVNNAKYKNKGHGKTQKYPKKVQKLRMHAIVESQADQIANLNQEIKELTNMVAALASKPSGLEADTANVNVVNFPDNFPKDISDINKDSSDDIFHFL